MPSVEKQKSLTRRRSGIIASLAQALACLLVCFSDFAHPATDELAKARAARAAGRFREAGEIYRRILQTTPASYEANFELAQTCLSAGDWKCAEEFSFEAEKLKPTDAAAAIVHGDALYRAGDANEAGLRYLRALSLDQKAAGALVGLASLKLQRNEVEGAITHLREALAIATDSPDGYYWLARSFEQQNQLALAADAYENWQRASPSNSVTAERARTIASRISLYRSFGATTALQIAGPRNTAVTLDTAAGAPVIDARAANGAPLKLLIDPSAQYPLTLTQEAAKRAGLAASLDLLVEERPCR